MLEVKKIDAKLDTAELVCTKTDGTKYNFNIFALPLKFIEKIHNYEITLDEAINDQKDLNILINKLNNDYEPRNTEKIEEKKRVLKSARKLQNARKDIISFFEEGIFPYRGNVFKTKEEQEKTKTDMNEIIKYIAKEEIDLNEGLFQKYFKIQRPSDMLMYLNKTNDKEKNNELVSLINSGLKDLKEEIKNMSEKERKIEKPDKIVKTVEEILNFNKQKQEGQGIKILTPNQMLSRLAISLAQLKAGNDSEKNKNEIRQLLCFLYRSEKLTKQLYKSLIGII